MPEINISKIPVGSGFAGFLFAAGTVAIFLAGIPALRYFLAAALALGVGVAVVLHLMER